MFLLFAGGYYYPCGGVEDYVGSFETEDLAKQFVKNRYDKQEEEYQKYIEDAENNAWAAVPDDYDWAHIATIRDGKLEMVLVYRHNNEWKDVTNSD